MFIQNVGNMFSVYRMRVCIITCYYVALVADYWHRNKSNELEGKNGEKTSISDYTYLEDATDGVMPFYVAGASEMRPGFPSGIPATNK
jgi:hypothetical protein